eukprot:c15310_g1_i3.p1 GENE.c15310_g1_i3~~c15310_g1_i3.p1  ORF type:complete len:349 (+),score=79.35 c15310_g1_i3:216-1262(+)
MGLIEELGGPNGTLLLQRVAALCPQTLGDDPAHTAKFEADRPALEKIKATLPEGLDLSVDDLLLLQLKLDHNCLGPGLFPLASLFNHACWFNAMGRPSAQDGMYEIVAIADVQPGDELTINYLEPKFWYLHVEHRQQILNSRWGFQCSCERCKGPKLAERFLEACRCNLTGNCSGNLLPDEIGATEFRCDKCGQRCPSSYFDDAQQEIYDEMKAAQGESDLDSAHKLLEGVLTKALSTLHPRHWLCVSAYNKLAETSFDLAMVSRDGDSDEAFNRLTRQHLEMVQSEIDALSLVLPPNAYPLSNLYDKLGYVAGVVEGQGGPRQEACMKRVVEIRNVCGWLVEDQLFE